MGEPIRIVVAEDRSLVRAGIRLLVDSVAGLDVVGEAEDVEQLIALAAEKQPDVVLLDLVMPGDGVLAPPRLKEVCPEARVLVLTGYVDPTLIREAMAQGASGYVLKSSEYAELVAAIRTIHAGGVYRDPGLEGARQAQSLSAREREVLSLVARGFTHREVAARLQISEKSVETYRSRLSHKLGVCGRSELVAFALEIGLLFPY